MNETIYWTPYSLFHFSQRQIRWVLDCEGEFDAGTWPKEPAGQYVYEAYDRHEKAWVEMIGCGSSGQTGHNGKRPAQTEAGFCKPAEIYTEVLSRIEACGKDGRLLLAQLAAGYEYLDRDAYNALCYASGYKRKETSYSDWLRIRAARRNAKNVTPGVSLPLDSSGTNI